MSAQLHAAPAAPELLRFDDVEIGRSQVDVHTVVESAVNAFGHLSGDLNPLHMEQAFAERSPFGRRVVHGLLTASLVSAAHTRLTGPGFAYVGQELRFLGPVFIDDTITINVTVVEKKDAKRILVMDTMVRNQRGKVVLSGLSALKELKFE
ncbi:MaoC family dehydratase [Caballeronia sp. LP006]|jgi:3-hydroxybutyryl-CoA dehydratase|uniref:MaoC family dehydratase n=1 Tax=unclassified Caballeronia TaxID=2646786 RepID=UPI001FD16F1B|nr:MULTISPECIES: MaoC family dehydratase [unclassified Caballeronia]MDR5774418.1 MaoC family dehydratase [Caballeronia sp. LZ002]MDR5805949.1 MaoC family dehydratase [Caballeronia sp. LZ001]MDR5826402.1 MaoC family dehydratase [Caballeronia sp. LP006]MDR5849853.1 MaoC family dehydratase [Caballeronia sp. LZ003]